MNRTVILVFALVSFSLFAKAQGKYDLYVGGSFPVGDFAGNESERSGSASTGLNIGLKYLFPVSAYEGLCLTGGVDLLYNGINQTGRDDFRKQAFSIGGVTDLTINYLSYLNVPVLVGVNYQEPIDKTFTVFEEVAFGINYSKATDMTMQFQYYGTNVKTTESFDPAIGMAGQVGAGLMIQKQYTIALHFNLLGSYAYNGKTTTTASGQTQTEDNPSNGKVSINTLNLTVGIRF